MGSVVSIPRTWESSLRNGYATAADGTRIAYTVLGRGTRTILIANGLGGKLYAWEPFLNAFWKDYQIVTWDYRGLYDSECPSSLRMLSVQHHADDAVRILDAEGVSSVIAAGWSMGVQVSLDLAS